MAQLVKPNALALSLAKATGRAITAKMVRSMARAGIGRFDKVAHEAYQSHEYTPAEVAYLTAAAKARGSRSSAPKPLADTTTAPKRAKAPKRAAKVAPVAPTV